MILGFWENTHARLLIFGGAYSNHLVSVAARFMKGKPRVRRESAELLIDPVASLDTQGMSVVCPRMANFQRLLQDPTQRANRLQGLLSRFLLTTIECRRIIRRFVGTKMMGSIWGPLAVIDAY